VIARVHQWRLTMNSKSQKSKEIINFAMFGAGRIGQVHGKNLADHPNVDLRFVCDPVADALAAMVTLTGAQPMSVDEVFSDTSIDAVLVASSTDTHADLIEGAVDAGKAVFCEKPIDLDLARARQVQAHVTKNNGICGLGFNRRFDPSFSALWRGVKEGKVGDVESVTIISRDPAPPPMAYVKVSGGLYRDMMIHDFDIARWMLGEEPTQVFAAGSCLIDDQIGREGDVDSAAVTLMTASGKLCQISNSRRASYGYDQRVEVHGSTGMLRIENPRPTALMGMNDSGSQGELLYDFFMDRYVDAYRLELDAFVEALLKGQKPDPDHNDGVAALALAEAAVQSQSTGRPVAVSNDA